MDSRKYVLKETLIVAAGVALCVAVMLGVFALLGKFDSTVLWGGVLGGVLAIANFFFMALGATLAADKAEAQNVKGGQALIQLSYIGRMVALFVILILCAKSGWFNLIALVLPLVFVRPTLTVAKQFDKKGGNEV